MDEHRQGVATNGVRAESRSEQGWGKDTSRTSHSGTSVYHFRRALDYLRSASKCLRTAQASIGSQSIRACAGLYADTIDADLRLVAPDMDHEDARLRAASKKRGVA